jgi:L-alanine-DL-glutamate epimerase-like enolase superfamily enzyme
MKITRVECVPYKIPYHHPIVAASGTLTSAEHVLIRIHTSEGAVGISEAVARPFVYGESQTSIVAAVREWFEPLLVGSDPFAVEDLLSKLSWIPANNTVHGAIDVALHDIRGKATKLPAWRMLGGVGKAMRVTHLLTAADPQEAAEEATKAVERYGVTSFKIKVGGDVDSDVARVAAIRNAVGGAAAIHLDANHGWSAEQAIRALTTMAPYNIDLVEEPCPAEDLIGRQRLSRHLSVTVMADESAPTLASASRELLTGSSRALSIKTTRTGFTVSGKLVALANALGARAVIGSQADGMIGAAASLAFGSAHPSVACEPAELDYYTILTDQLVIDPLIVLDGSLAPSDAPGIGVDIDEDKLNHYRLDE